MAFDISTFRTNFPEFTDTTKYPDARITFWYNVAYKMLNIERWGDFLDEGYSLFVAHNITLSEVNTAAVAIPGNVPGRNTSLISSKSVGGVSVSLDNQASLEDAAGNYNETVYGRQFIRLSRIVGMGGAFV
jgi:hypothetical protein